MSSTVTPRDTLLMKKSLARVDIPEGRNRQARGHPIKVCCALFECFDDFVGTQSSAWNFWRITQGDLIGRLIIK